MSTLKADTIQSTGGGAATLTKQEAAKSRVSATITSDTHTIQDSFNVASLTDDGAGKTDVVFTNNMNNDDYASGFGTNTGEPEIHTLATSSFRASMLNSSGSNNDKSIVSYIIFGDLA